jgi:hypothetical protein
MAFRFLVVFLSLVLAVSCLSRIDYQYNSYPREEIEEFNGSSYAVVSSNYYLAKTKCEGCIKKGRGLGFMDEYLVSPSDPLFTSPPFSLSGGQPAVLMCGGLVVDSQLLNHPRRCSPERTADLPPDHPSTGNLNVPSAGYHPPEGVQL